MRQILVSMVPQVERERLRLQRKLMYNVDETAMAVLGTRQQKGWQIPKEGGKIAFIGEPATEEEKKANALEEAVRKAAMSKRVREDHSQALTCPYCTGGVQA